MATDFDYIVVGGGSAGCVVAGELAGDPAVRVLLLECEDPAEANPETLRADGYKDAFRNDRLIWERFSAPQTACGGRRLFLGTGRGMGSSGSVNSMVYTRGDARDYDAWPRGWRWNDNVAAFEAVENRLGLQRREPTRWTEAAMAAAQLAGFRSSPDLNDGDLSGAMGYEWMNYHENTRRSSYVAFIQPKRSPADNLVIKTGALAQRVLVEGHQAVGVMYKHEGATYTVRTTGEVILTAGALETPKLLLLSGIGARENLRIHGIPTAVENKEVGRNLHDHPNVTLFFRGHEPVDCYYPQLYGFHRVGTSPGLALAQSDTCYVMYSARSSLHEAMVRMLPTVLLPERLYNLGWVRGATRSAIDLAFGAAWLRRQVARVYGIVVILGKPSSAP